MTFGDTPPLKSVNVDMRRRRRQRRNLWCPFVLPLHQRQQDLQVPCLMRSWPASTTSSRNSNVDAGRNMVTNVRPLLLWRLSQALLFIWNLHQVLPLHGRPSQAPHMTWCLLLVPPPHWPPYGKMKTLYVTIAKAKTMIHENVPISCAHYAIEEVT